MKSLLAVAFVLSMLCSGADTIAPGKYTGNWEGSSGASGDLQITLTPDSDGKLTPDVTFTIGGQEVKTKITSFKLDGAKMSVVYSWDAQGNSAESSVEGELKGKTLEGKYHTRLLPDGGAIDEGTWKATTGAK
jgi:hypothetical protein